MRIGRSHGSQPKESPLPPSPGGVPSTTCGQEGSSRGSGFHLSLSAQFPRLHASHLHARKEQVSSRADLIHPSAASLCLALLSPNPPAPPRHTSHHPSRSAPPPLQGDCYMPTVSATGRAPCGGKCCAHRGLERGLEPGSACGQPGAAVRLRKPDMGLLDRKWRVGELSSKSDLESLSLGLPCCPWVDPSASWAPHLQVLFWSLAPGLSAHTFPPSSSVTACLWVPNHARRQFTRF